MSATVAVVMPAYRAERWLPFAVASVQAQTFTDWELLIVDDGSPDATHAVATRLAAGDPRIRVLQSSEGKGPAAARSTAIRATEARYIAFLDADDLWLPRKLERQLAHLQATGAGLCYTSFRRIDATGARVGRFIAVPASLRHRDLLGNTAIVTSSVLIDRQRVGELSPRQTHHDDMVLWLDTLRSGEVAQGLGEDLVRYRVLPQSYSRNKWRNAWHVWRTLRDVEGLGVLPALYHFAQYAVRAAIKHARF